MEKPIVFTDLDDTVFQTARKMDTPPADPNAPASWANNGSHSYMTRAQEKMFGWLNSTTRLIPVTARSTEALSRCTLPFTDYQVASNGAIILMPDGSVDQVWMDRTREISNQLSGMMSLLEDFVSDRNEDQNFRHWIVQEEGCDIYYCVKSNGQESWLDGLQEKLTSLSNGLFLVHRNGNNLSLTPKDISKKAAVDYLIEKIGEDGLPIWGMGDSTTDLPFMESCQMMVIPTGSQAHKIFEKRG